MATLTAAFDIRDRMTRRINRMNGNFRKLRDSVDQVQNKVKKLSGTRATIRTRLQDRASHGLSRLNRAAETLNRVNPTIITQLRDAASRGLTKVHNMADILSGLTATIRTRHRDEATRSMSKLRTLARSLERMRVAVTTRVRDNASRGLAKVISLARSAGSKTVTIAVRIKDTATRAITRIESGLAGLQNKILGIGAAMGGTAILSQGANAFATDAQASAISGIKQPEITAMTDQIYYDDKVGTERTGVAQSLVNYAQQTDLQGQALQNAARTSAMFAQLYGKDIPETDRAFASAYKNQLGSMSEIGDVSAYVLKNAGDQYDDYLDTINEYGSTFKDLQLNMGQVGSAFVAAVQAGGRNFDEPADMFREFNIRRSELTDNQITAMAKVLGKDRTRELYKAMDTGTLSGEKAMFEFATALSKIPSETQRAAYATELLGTKYEDIKEPMLAAARAIQEPIEATGELEKQFSTMRDNNPMTAINDTTRELGKTVKDIGQSVLTAVTPAFVELNKWASSPEGQKSIASFTESVSELSGELANGLSKGIRWTIKNWDTLLPILKWVGGAFLGVYAAAKGYQGVKASIPVFKGLGKVISVIWNILKWTGSALLWFGKGFLKILNWAKPFIPWVGRVVGALGRFVPVVGWVITALGLLWAAWKNWDTIKGIVSNAFQGAKDAVAEGVNWILKKVNWMIEKLNGISVDIPFYGEVGFNLKEFGLLETQETRDNNKKAVSILTGGKDNSDNPMMSGKIVPVSSFPNLLPNHSNGISDIPYDNYKANLHKGETVLPREEADLIRNMAASGGGNTPAASASPTNIYITGDNHYHNEMDAKQVVRIIKKELEDEHNNGPQGVQFV